MPDTPWPYPFPHANAITEGVENPAVIEIQIDEQSLESSLHLCLINHGVSVPTTGIRVIYNALSPAVEDIRALIENSVQRVFLFGKGAPEGPGQAVGQQAEGNEATIWLWNNHQHALEAILNLLVGWPLVVIYGASNNASIPFLIYATRYGLWKPEPGESTDPVDVFLEYLNALAPQEPSP